jgi:tetratricopeptide (TPR) repeat protein
MSKANLKSVFFITLITTLTLLVGCSSPEEKKAAQIKDALALSAEGAHAEALNILEELASQYPNDIEILNSMGQIYTAEGDTTMAAFFLEQAYLQSPEDTELLFKTYLSLEVAKQPAGHLLEKLTTQAPEAMTPELWVRLGEIRQAVNEVQPALDAYLKGVDPDKRKPSLETAAAIGQLFAKAGNLPQAEKWLEIAADNDDPNALTALFALLEVNLRQKDWAGAEATITQLDKQFPGAVEASQWQQQGQELKRWRAAQDEMKANRARAEAEEKAAEALTAAAAAAAAIQPPAADSETPSDSGNAETADNSETAESPPTEGKVITDIEAAEAMANAPAIELPQEGVTITSEEAGSRIIAFNPDIAIEPADPAITFEVSFDQLPIAQEPSYRIDNSPTFEPAPALESAPTFEPVAPVTPRFTDFRDQAGQAGQAPLAPVRPSTRPPSIEELMADAETATFDRDYKSAIRKYWAAISIANNRAEIWNLLSRAYLVDGQLNNADTSALEAVRLEPREVAYTLDYLRVAQRTKEPANFLAELETAYARFPSSPEITLSLARAHERISLQTQTARNLYLRFIDIAPNHPLVPEARAAVLRTQQR